MRKALLPSRDNGILYVEMKQNRGSNTDWFFLQLFQTSNCKCVVDCEFLSPYTYQ